MSHRRLESLYETADRIGENGMHKRSINEQLEHNRSKFRHGGSLGGKRTVHLKDKDFFSAPRPDERYETF